MPTNVIYALAGYFVFSAAAGAMAKPTKEQETKFYGFFYRFIQTLAANAARVAESRFGALAGEQPGANAAFRAVSSSTSIEQLDVATSSATK